MPDSIIGRISVGDGATFTPAIDSDGVLTFSNNKNLPNPEPFDVPGAVINSGAMTPGSENGTIAFGGNDVAVTGWDTKANVASPAFTGTPTAPTPASADNTTKIATTAYVQGEKTSAITTANSYTDEQIRQHGNLPVGYEYFTFNPSIPQGSLPLFGGEYSRDTYSDLWAWVQTQTGYLKTEAEWQTLSASNNGNVPFYSDGDGSTTFRVPSLKCWVKGANGTVSEVGSYLAAGLPDITGMLYLHGGEQASIISRGAVTNNALYGAGGSETQYRTIADLTVKNNAGSYGNIHFSASRSSSIYGNANTVVPESIVGMWLVKAYGVIVDTGTIDEQQYIDDRFAAAKDYTDMEVETGVPTGCVQAFAGQTTPTGWLLCDGSAVSRVTYAKLFSVIGTSYGAGDGSTTFNLPDLVDKFVQGNATSGTVKEAALPNILGETYILSANNYSTKLSISSGGGAFYGTTSPSTPMLNSTQSGGAPSEGTYNRLGISASRSSSVYKNGVTTVQPPAVTMRYIIKY